MRHFPFLLLLPALALASLPVDDFESSGTTLPGGGAWIHYQDSASSEATWTRGDSPGADGSAYCGKIEVDLSGASGWAGVSGALSPSYAETDVSAYAGVRLKARTNAGSLKVQLPITATNKVYNHFAKGLAGADTTWRLFELPFSKFKQEWGTAVAWDPKTILQVALLVMNDSKGTVWAQIDDIEFYKAGEEKVALDTSVFVSKFPKVNQVGYEPSDRKVAVGTMPFHNPGDSLWVVDENRHRAWGGIWNAAMNDSLSSGERVVQGDFSGFTEKGAWRIESNALISAPFRVGPGVLADLYANALHSMRSIRCGMAIHDERIGMNHAPCHMQDTLRSDGGAPGDFTGGWHNAGDFGKWVPEAAISTASFLWLAELDKNRSGLIPTGREALLDEARWGLRWILKMQQPDGSMLHKVDPEPNFAWGIGPDKDTLTRWASRQSKNSTGASSVDAAIAVAIMTQGARVFAGVDPSFAAALAKAADNSWSWLAGHPGILQTDIYYHDTDSRQEEFWAAAERSRQTKSDSLRNVALASLKTLAFAEMNWNAPQVLGALALQSDSSCPKELRDAASAVLTKLAKSLLVKSKASGYRVALSPWEYWWESNENVLHRGEALLYGFLATGDSTYLVAARAQLDYVLGQNSLDTSFVTGFGAKAIRHPYHWSTFAYGTPLPGWVTGGPNHYASTLADVAFDSPLYELVNDRKTPPAKSYLDLCTANGSYASNEGETSEQAALIFLSGWFAGPGAWAAPSVATSPRQSGRKLSTLLIARHGRDRVVTWPGHAGETLEIRDPAGRSAGTLVLDSDAKSRWTTDRRGLFLVVPRRSPTSGIRIFLN